MNELIGMLRDECGDEEETAQRLLLIFAGNETTTHLLGNGLLALLRHPEQLEHLRNDPALMRGAIEECLRFEGPVQGLSRVARVDLLLHGRLIRKDDPVVLLLGSANRDSACFDAADCLDIRRVDKAHLAFGGGIHFCLGAALARLLTEEGLLALLAFSPKLRLTSRPLQWRAGNLTFRGLMTLPVLL